jgi:hypothetical protein
VEPNESLTTKTAKEEAPPVQVLTEQKPKGPNAKKKLCKNTGKKDMITKRKTSTNKLKGQHTKLVSADGKAIVTGKKGQQLTDFTTKLPEPFVPSNTFQYVPLHCGIPIKPQCEVKLVKSKKTVQGEVSQNTKNFDTSSEENESLQTISAVANCFCVPVCANSSV